MPSPSLFLGSSTTLVSALLLLSSSASATSNTRYVLDTQYKGNSFFDGFTFIDVCLVLSSEWVALVLTFTQTADPTHGFVTYVEQPSFRRMPTNEEQLR
jgi:hypothetical protein